MKLSPLPRSVSADGFDLSNTSASASLKSDVLALATPGQASLPGAVPSLILAVVCAALCWTATWRARAVVATGRRLYPPNFKAPEFSTQQAGLDTSAEHRRAL